MKRRLFIGLMLILLMGVEIVASTIKDDVLSDEIQRTLGLDNTYSMSINKIRKEVGLEPLTISDVLKEMADFHTKYMHYNNTLTSVEEKDQVYYRGRYPWDRGDHFNYELDFVYEFVKKDYANYIDGYVALLNDPISRYVLLNPMYTEIGMSAESSYMTYELGGNKKESDQLIVYPYNGQESVMKAWTGDLLDDIKNKSKEMEEKVGLPITFMYYGKEVSGITNPYIIFKDTATDKWVDFMVILPDDLHQLRNGLTIVPLHPYKSTKYRVTVDFDLKFENGKTKHISETIYFSTTARNKRVESPYVTRAGFIQKVISNKYLDFTLIEPLERTFIDVGLQSNEGIYIYTANQEKLISGYPDGRFRPELNITKEQAYKILVDAYEKKNSKIMVDVTKGLKKYKDQGSISSWARPYLLKADTLGIIVHQSGWLKPNDYITEVEFKTVMEAYNKILKENK